MPFQRQHRVGLSDRISAWCLAKLLWHRGADARYPDADCWTGRKRGHVGHRYKMHVDAGRHL
ncbi:MAG: hypothetical protein VX017_10965, partial [Pseudomonadota bacterium]|nr:hypothetical protein [Pseudomonadota bacterium]